MGKKIVLNKLMNGIIIQIFLNNKTNVTILLIIRSSFN